MEQRVVFALGPVVAMFAAAWLVLRLPDLGQTAAFFTASIPTVSAGEAAMTMLAWIVVITATCLGTRGRCSTTPPVAKPESGAHRLGVPCDRVDASGRRCGPSRAPEPVGVLWVRIRSPAGGNPACSLSAIFPTRLLCSSTMRRTQKQSHAWSAISRWNAKA